MILVIYILKYILFTFTKLFEDMYCILKCSTGFKWALLCGIPHNEAHLKPFSLFFLKFGTPYMDSFQLCLLI